MTPLETPIKIRWTGKSRMKFGERHAHKSDARIENIWNTLDRQKTNVVVETVEEATALASGLNGYRNEGGKHGRIWANGATDMAFERVHSEIIEAMAERGYTVVNPDRIVNLEFTR